MQVSAGCSEVLSALLEPQAVQRVSVQDILHHPWFTQVCPKSVPT